MRGKCINGNQGVLCSMNWMEQIKSKKKKKKSRISTARSVLACPLLINRVWKHRKWRNAVGTRGKMVATRRGVRVSSPSKTNSEQSSDVPVSMSQTCGLHVYMFTVILKLEPGRIEPVTWLFTGVACAAGPPSRGRRRSTVSKCLNYRYVLRTEKISIEVWADIIKSSHLSWNKSQADSHDKGLKNEASKLYKLPHF